MIDKRADKRVPAHICQLANHSSWGSDYLSIGAFYDFGYDKDAAKHAPIISLFVDVPFHGLVAEYTSRTHSVSLRIESRL